ncbi:hypothetical protein ACP70R_039881 [Stipagrostis hirtigluma subsp. patula]
MDGTYLDGNILAPTLLDRRTFHAMEKINLRRDHCYHGDCVTRLLEISKLPLTRNPPLLMPCAPVDGPVGAKMLGWDEFTVAASAISVSSK